MAEVGEDARFFIPGKRKNQAPMFVSAADAVVFGTESECDLRIADPIAEGRHGRLAFVEGSFEAEDLGSSTGLYLDGLPVEGRVVLPAKGSLVFGASRLGFEVVEDNGQQRLRLQLEEKSFYFVEKGKGERLADLYQWVRSEVGFGRWRGLALANLGALAAAVGVVALSGGASFREPLTDPGALHAKHAWLFEANADAPSSARGFAAEFEIAQREGCNACHDPFHGTTLQKCAQCHGDLIANQHPFLSEERADLGWHDEACSQCHIDHTRGGDWDFVPAPDTTPDSCARCHGDEPPTSKRDPVAVPVARTEALQYDAFPHAAHLSDLDDPIACSVCHQPTAKASSLDGRDFPVVVFETCVKCHSSDAGQRDSQLAGQMSGEVLWTVAWHGTDGNGENCLQCHTRVNEKELREETVGVPSEIAFELPGAFNHDEFFAGHPDFRPGENPFGSGADAQSCEDCHLDGNFVSSSLPASPFYHRLHMATLDPGGDEATARELSTGEHGCTTCHAAIASSSTLSEDPWRGSEGHCGACHQGADPVPRVGAQVQRRRFQSFPHDVHVAAFAKEGVLSQGCYSCHEFSQSSDDFAASAMTKPEASSCVACHAGHANVAGGDCQQCHAPDDPVWSAARVEIDRPQAGAFSHYSVGHEPLTTGGSCSECHTTAGTNDARTISAVLLPTEADPSCRDCHVNQKARFHWR